RRQWETLGGDSGCAPDPPSPPTPELACSAMTEPGPPAEQERRPPWPLIAAAVIVVMAVAAVVIAQMGDEEEPAPSSTTPVETTASAPTTTEAPTTTPPVETTVTSVAPTTTTPATTTATTEAPAAGYPPEAIAVEGADLVRVDTATGASEVLHAFLFEAASGQKLALGSEGTAYLHFLEEDYWFTCESAAGRVEGVDVESGATGTLAAGRPALSPNASTLAYLPTQECYPHAGGRRAGPHALRIQPGGSYQRGVLPGARRAGLLPLRLRHAGAGGAGRRRDLPDPPVGATSGIGRRARPPRLGGRHDSPRVDR